MSIVPCSRLSERLHMEEGDSAIYMYHISKLRAGAHPAGKRQKGHMAMRKRPIDVGSAKTLRCPDNKRKTGRPPQARLPWVRGRKAA